MFQIGPREIGADLAFGVDLALFILQCFSGKAGDFSHFSRDSFVNDLALVNWNDILPTRGDDVDILFSSFCSKFNKMLNKHAPMKTLSKRRIKKLSKPCITKG